MPVITDGVIRYPALELFKEDDTVITFPTAQGRNFNVTHSTFANGFSETETNDVVRLGWNLAYGGGREVEAEHAVGLEFERFYAQAADLRWTEVHLMYASPSGLDGGIRRCFSWLIDTLVDDTATAYFQASSYEWRDFTESPGTTWMSLDTNRLTMSKPILMPHDVGIFGLDSGASQAEMIKVNTSDQVRVGDTLYPVLIPKQAIIGDIGGGDDGDLRLIANTVTDTAILTFQNNTTGQLGMRWIGSDANLRTRFLSEGEGFYWYTSSNGGSSYTRRMALYGQKLFVGDEAANANMTVGLTVQQGGADDQALALKSTDVAHGVTTFAETDTYFSIGKYDPALGGVLVDALSSGANDGAFVLRGVIGTASTAKTTGATGALDFRSALTNGTGTQSLGANGNLAVFRDNTTTRFILDADGDAHADVSWITF